MEEVRELIVKNNDTYTLTQDVSQKIAEFERAVKELKEHEEKLKTQILEEMETKGLIKLDTDDLTITYVASTDRESFDSKTFREEHPDLYDEYVRISPVKSSIRIKVK